MGDAPGNATWLAAETQNVEWFVAEIVMEITIAGTARNVVHRNLVLLRADSAAQAYDKAIRLGHESETSYQNPEGRLVTHRFAGLSKLEEVPWGLEDGSELTFDESVGVPQEEIESWLRPKGELAAFRPPRRRPQDDTDYSSAEVLDLVTRTINRGPKRPS
jgi:uncharacterized protein DUF4288